MGFVSRQGRTDAERVLVKEDVLFVCLDVRNLRLLFGRIVAIEPGMNIPAIRAITRLAHRRKFLAILGTRLVAQCSEAGVVDNETTLSFWIRALAIAEASAFVAAATTTFR